MTVHYLYDREQIGSEIQFKLREERSLAGINRGMIPHLLEIHLNGSGCEPKFWHLNIREELDKSRWPNCTLLIDLKPNDSAGNISLYEIVEAWGHSNRGWTPVMFHLRALFKDEYPSNFDRQSFTRKLEDIDDPIFTMLYMKGSIVNGELVGGWTFPASSSTNSVLLWPETFEYFAEHARRTIRQLR